jgi:hypothetical protein
MVVDEGWHNDDCKKDEAVLMNMQKVDHAPHPAPMEVMSTALWFLLTLNSLPISIHSLFQCHNTSFTTLSRSSQCFD